MNKKNLLLFVLFVLLMRGTLADWNPTQIWNTNFSFGGQTDEALRMLIHENMVLTVGLLSGSPSFGASSNFNLLTGATNWIKVDPNSQTMAGSPFAVCGNNVFYATGSLGGRFLVVRNINTGNLVLNQPISTGMVILGYGDSLIAVTQESSSKVLIMNSSGTITRQFSLGYNLTQGMLTVKRCNENIWINGYFFSNGVPNFFVEKRNLFSGNLIWRHELPKAIRCFGDIDGFGNFYTASNIDSTNKWWFMMEKIDPNRNQQWQKIWVPNQYGPAENTVAGISVSPKGDIVTLVGTSNVGNPPNNNFYKGYVYSRNAQNGDSVFSFLVQNTVNTQCGLRDVAFDTSGAFIIIGVESTSPSRTLFARKYQKDSLVGVINPMGEIPKDYSLSQNYPNPFNPSTKIKFQTPFSPPEGEKHNHFVTLKIYNILGREVQSLVNDNLSPGTYEVEFDGTNFSSGVYYYTLSTGDFSETKKMLMIK